MNQRRILVIDDTAEDRVAIRRFLLADREQATTLEETTTGEEGLARCLSGEHDLVLLDLHLPKLDGLAVLRALKNAPRAVPVVVLTGSGYGSLSKQALELGAVDFLLKDELTPTSLTRAISNAIVRARMQRREEQAAARSAALVALSNALSDAATPSAVIDLLLGEGLRTAGANGGLVALLAPDRKHLVIQDSRGYLAAAVEPWRQMPLDAQLPVSESARTNDLVTISTKAEQDERYPEMANSVTWVGAMAVLPLRSGEDLQGVLAMNFPDDRAFDEADRAFLLLLARVGGQALRRARTQQGEHRAREEARIVAERYRALVEASTPIVWRTDHEGNTIFATDAWERCTGQTTDEARGHGWVDAIHPEDRERTVHAWTQAVSTASVYNNEFRVRDGQGGWRHHEVRAVPVLEADGRVREWVGANQDITNRRLLEQERERLRQEAVQQAAELQTLLDLLKARAEFEKQLIGIVSHDLKNPLQIILLSAQMLKKQGKLDGATPAVDRILAAARQSRQLISDLLDFAKSRTGSGFAVLPRPADLGELARRAVASLRAAHPDRRLEVHDEGDLTGHWDADRLDQVFTNLIANALQHGVPAAPVTISVRPHGSYVRLEVHNQGLPIPPALLPHLFEAFRGGARQQSNNAGLGLFIVDQVVKAHAGTVSVTSTEADGTRFVVELPRTAPGARAQLPQPEALGG